MKICVRGLPDTEERESGRKIHEEIMVKNLLNLLLKCIHPRSSTNYKQDKSKDIHTQTNHYQDM